MLVSWAPVDLCVCDVKLLFEYKGEVQVSVLEEHHASVFQSITFPFPSSIIPLVNIPPEP